MFHPHLIIQSYILVCVVSCSSGGDVTSGEDDVQFFLLVNNHCIVSDHTLIKC
jgi:hypothetical protein